MFEALLRVFDTILAHDVSDLLVVGQVPLERVRGIVEMVIWIDLLIVAKCRWVFLVLTSILFDVIGGVLAGRVSILRRLCVVFDLHDVFKLRFLFGYQVFGILPFFVR